MGNENHVGPNSDLSFTSSGSGSGAASLGVWMVHYVDNIKGGLTGCASLMDTNGFITSTGTGSGTGSCLETNSIPNTPSKSSLVTEEYQLSCRNEQGIYDLMEHYESKDMRVKEIHGPAWLARMARGMKAFDVHSHPNRLIGSIYGMSIFLDNKRDDKVKVVVAPCDDYCCSCRN